MCLSNAFPVLFSNTCSLQVNTAFISQCARVLSAGGTFQTLTDDAGYAAAIVRELEVAVPKSLFPIKGKHFSISQSKGVEITRDVVASAGAR